jgi:hypothetical protein
MDGIAVAGEVVTAGTALAGLILIYIGSLVNAFGSYQAQEQKTVRTRFLRRAWVAFVGMVLALVAAAMAVLAKWLQNGCLGDVSVWFLLAAFAWAILSVVLIIREIR